MRYHFTIRRLLPVWLMFLLLYAASAQAQKMKAGTYRMLNHSGCVLKINDSVSLVVYAGNGACKGNHFAVRASQWQAGTYKKVEHMMALTQRNKNEFIHGDITYDYFYRSAIDTPFSDNNINQHTIRANVQLVIAKKLPVVLQVNSRQSNSYLFKNYTDVSVQFNSHAYNTAARDKLAGEIISQLQAASPAASVLKALQEAQAMQEKTRQWLEGNGQLQQLTESRALLASFAGQRTDSLQAMKETVTETIQVAEKRKLATFSASPSLTGMNAVTQWRQALENNGLVKKQQGIDSLRKKLEKAEKFVQQYETAQALYKKYTGKTDSLHIMYNTAKEEGRQKIEEIKNTFATGSTKRMHEKVKEYGLDSSKTFKWYRRIHALQQLSVGRSMVDYAELSAKNISITGLQLAYQGKYYIAFATGAVDYQYRDFIGRNYQRPKQYLSLVRMGVGLPDMHHLYFTVYQGRKQANYFSTGYQPAVNRIFGIAIQGKLRLNDNNYIVAEAAKSSYPQLATVNSAISNNKTFSFANHSNEAYSVQLFSRVAYTGTRLYAQYKYLGRNFQSFSIYNTSSDFTSWQARVDQYFFRKKLFVAAGLRTSDYNNPYIATRFSSNTVFKILQATLRIKHWPVLSAGYMPSSQLTSVGNQLVENHFYTLTASGHYVYRTRRAFMNTGAVYTKFYNAATDSGFVYYHARNWLLYHHIIANTFSFNSLVTLSYSSNYRLLTIDQGMHKRIGKSCQAGAGIRWSRLNHSDNQFGYYGNLEFSITPLGVFNLSFDKGSIPGTDGKLRGNDFGRATYIKTF